MPGHNRKILVLVLLFAMMASYGHTFFQERKINTDSLRKVLDTVTGKQRIMTLSLLAWQYRLGDAEKSIPYAEEAYRLSRGMNDPEMDLVASYSLALAHHHTGDYPKAVRYGLDAFEMAQSMNDTNMVYLVGHCIVFSYLYSFNYDLAIRYTFDIMAYLKSWKHPAQEFEKYIRAGWIYMMTGRYREAIPYYLETERYAMMTDLVPPEKIALNYMHIADCYLYLEEYDSAKIYIDACERYCLAHQVDFTEFALDSKGTYYLAKEQYDSAAYCFNRIVQQAGIKGSLIGLSNGLYMTGKVYKEAGKFPKAVEAFEKAIENATILADNRVFFLDSTKIIETWYAPEQIVPHYMERVGLRMLVNSHEALYGIFKEQGNYRKALIHIELRDIANNRLRELDKKKDVVEINTRYVTERKEQQIEMLSGKNELSEMRLNQTRYFLFGLAGFIFLALLVALLLIRQSRMKAMKDRTTLEQRLLRAQMNPHFLFNSLASIQGYMLENDASRANHYLSRFAKLVRNILENTSRDVVPVSQEILTIENYLELQKIRYEGKFDYEIVLDEAIDPESTCIPPMLAQPFIENAIEHGIRYLPSHGRITIKISPLTPLTTLLAYEITDNGVGREQAALLEQSNGRNHRPMATSITMDRLRVLSQKTKRRLKKEIKLEINDLRDDKGNVRGTSVRLVIPAEKK
jgi:tetratricopeptide (TPR) repeat protein